MRQRWFRKFLLWLTDINGDDVKDNEDGDDDYVDDHDDEDEDDDENDDDDDNDDHGTKIDIKVLRHLNSTSALLHFPLSLLGFR